MWFMLYYILNIWIYQVYIHQVTQFNIYNYLGWNTFIATITIFELLYNFHNFTKNTDFS